MSVNKQIIIGNLGKDPDVRTYQDGSKVCRFTVAVTEKAYTLQNGTQVPEHTEWFNILCRGKKAEVAESFLHKGDKVYIEGSTYTGEYQDQQGMTKRYTEVRCEVLEMLTQRQQAQAPQQYAPQAPQQYAPQAPQQYAQQYQQPPQYAPQAPQQYAPQAAPQYAPQTQQAAPQQTQQVGVYGQRAQLQPAEQERPF